MKQFLATVAVENVAYHFDILYSYIIPDSLLKYAKVGSRVLVPFGRSKTTKRQGIIFSVEEKTDNKTTYKEILQVLDGDTFVSDEMLKVAHFLKDRTFCTYFEAVKVQIPAGFNYKTTVTYFAKENINNVSLNEEEKLLHQYMLTLEAFETKNTLYKAVGFGADSDIMEKLIAKKLVVKSYDAKKTIKDASVKMVEISMDNTQLTKNGIKLTPKQKQVYDFLLEVQSTTVKELCYYTGVTVAVINNLINKGILNTFEQTFYRIPQTYINDAGNKEKIILNDEQNTAYDNLLSIYNNGGGVSLLYGVTGSGKTSVFLKLIDGVIENGRQVIVMVPEISLTPQMMSIFKGRYGDKVAIFHSALSVGERRDEYKRVKDGDVKIVVGTRSAVFAPFDNLGLIVVDEEQEHTYKSEASPRYNAKEIARFRAGIHKALVVLSSATPSVESYTYAVNNKFSLQKLSKRYGVAVLPDVSVVDTKEEKRKGNKYSISSELLELLENNIAQKKQSILLINRRGYNTFVACDSCGNVITCPYCSISLTYHSANNRLMCHYCGYSAKMSRLCPECGKEQVRYAGYGTQRIEDEIKLLLPEAKVLRMDTDSTSSRYAFEKGLVAFGNGEYDIMLGTQMVAKGLNFENVTLVGVINADQQLNNDDFRSQERTFDLLTQVVGRSGRGSQKGKAVIQTITPENNVIKLAQHQDYESFYNSEITIRKAMIYPPFCDICSVMFISEKEEKALIASNKFLSRLKELIETKYNDQKIIVLGPMPPRVSKINNKYRYRIIIKCKNSKQFRAVISELLIEFGKNKDFSVVSIVPDINPENLI